jgi:hypothetical protein
MSERAECAMLNKGPYINDAVVVLDSILRRMTDHHYKKNALLGSLHSWYPDSGTPTRTMTSGDERLHRPPQKRS